MPPFANRLNKHSDTRDVHMYVFYEGPWYLHRSDFLSACSDEIYINSFGGFVADKTNKKPKFGSHRPSSRRGYRNHLTSAFPSRKNRGVGADFRTHTTENVCSIWACINIRFEENARIRKWTTLDGVSSV